jgi:hypothetical protein
MERAALPPLILSAALGWGYLAAGLWQQEKAGLTLAAVCYLLAALFLIVALYPAGRCPADRLFPACFAAGLTCIKAPARPRA